MRLNRKWLLVISLVLSLTMATAGTLAYLTDRDSEANIFTIGNVEIDLHESFEQGAALIPGANIAKKPVITNTGKTNAWVWLEFAIPSALDHWALGTEAGSNENVIHWNQLGATTEGYVNADRVSKAIADGHLPEGITAEEITDNKMTWNIGGKEEFSKQKTINVDGKDVKYSSYIIGYNKALTPGESTLPNVYKVFLDTRVDIDTDGKVYFVENGVAKDLNWNINTDGAPVIYVSAYAIQEDGFANVDEAIRAYNGQWGDNGSEYGANVSGGSTEGNLTLEEDVTTRDKALYQSYTATEDYTIDGQGNTVTSVITDVSKFTWEGGTIPAQSMIFSSSNGSTVTVKDLKVEGTMSAIMLGHYKNSTYNNYNTVMTNVDVVGTEVVSFSSNVSPAVCVYGTATLNNCNIYGTTLSELDTDPMWPVYDIAVVNYSTLNINNDKNHKIGTIHMWNQAAVNVNSGTVDTIVIRGNMNTTKPEYRLTVKSGATVNTVDLSAITDKNRVNITIEDGANVGKYVANGVEYASIADWQADQ